MICRVDDDSGFLALVDPDAYQTFVDRDWEMDQLFAHFETQMRLGRLLLWGTGLEFLWPVRVEVDHPAPAAGAFREASGPIIASRGRLLVTSYDSLTMVAQFADDHLPRHDEHAQIITLPAGAYGCTVRQLSEPPDGSKPFEPPLGFELFLNRTDAPPPPWTKVPWFDYRG